MDWEKEGVNYWENPDCPREYLEKSLVDLISYVEGVVLSEDSFEEESRESLVNQVGFYEYLSDK